MSFHECPECGCRHYSQLDYENCPLKDPRENPRELAESKRRENQGLNELREIARQMSEARRRGERTTFAEIEERVTGRKRGGPKVARHRVDFVGPPLAEYPRPSAGLQDSEWSKYGNHARKIARCFGDDCPLAAECWRYCAEPSDVSVFFRRPPFNQETKRCLYYVASTLQLEENESAEPLSKIG